MRDSGVYDVIVAGNRKKALVQILKIRTAEADLLGHCFNGPIPLGSTVKAQTQIV